MPTAQKLFNEGIEKGIRGMLKLDMDTAIITAAFDIPEQQATELIERIKHEKQ